MIVATWCAFWPIPAWSRPIIGPRCDPLTKNRALSSGDWSPGEKKEILGNLELVLGVGVIPTAPGEGLRHIPRGSDWPSIREAGMHAAKLGASSDDPASPDGYGYAQEENATVERLNQRKRLIHWSQNGNGPRAGAFRHDRHSPHRGPGGVFSLYVHRHTRNGNGVTPGVLSEDGQSSGGVPTAWRTGRDHVRSQCLRESRRIC